ncbi:MAG: hypothetical protein ACYSTT_03380 [Planctomycetota bacterium]
MSSIQIQAGRDWTHISGGVGKMGVAEWIIIMVIVCGFWYCRKKPG